MIKIKRKILTDIGISWLLFISLFVVIILEQHLNPPWNRITNGLWFIGMITMTFFLIRGMFRLVKFERNKR
jgi:hypothetical protein